MQNVVDYQKTQALRDYGIGQQLRKAQGVGQGAFGGNRATLAQGLNAQNYDLARQQAIAQGYNQAFNQAQQAQQYGAGLGLQGLNAAAGMYGQGLGAANQLANIGNTALGAQTGIINAQTQQGATQQAIEQQKINQAIQDYATQQQYPYMQLGIMNAMLRGLPQNQELGKVLSNIEKEGLLNVAA